MELSKLYNSVENIDNSVDRCMAYCEIILYLQGLKEAICFKEEKGWRELINKELLKDIRNELDSKISEIKHFVEFNVKH